MGSGSIICSFFFGSHLLPWRVSSCKNWVCDSWRKGLAFLFCSLGLALRSHLHRFIKVSLRVSLAFLEFCRNLLYVCIKNFSFTCFILLSFLHLFDLLFHRVSLPCVHTLSHFFCRFFDHLFTHRFFVSWPGLAYSVRYALWLHCRGNFHSCLRDHAILFSC